MRKHKSTTYKFHEFTAHPMRGNANRSKSSQRQGPIIVHDDRRNPLDPATNEPKKVDIDEFKFEVYNARNADALKRKKPDINRSRSGRQLSDDATPVEVLDRDVRATLAKVNLAKIIELTFVLAHHKMTTKRRKILEHNLTVYKRRYERYTTNSLQATQRKAYRLKPIT